MESPVKIVAIFMQLICIIKSQSKFIFYKVEN